MSGDWIEAELLTEHQVWNGTALWGGGDKRFPKTEMRVR